MRRQTAMKPSRLPRQRLPNLFGKKPLKPVSTFLKRNWHACPLILPLTSIIIFTAHRNGKYAPFVCGHVLLGCPAVSARPMACPCRGLQPDHHGDGSSCDNGCGFNGSAGGLERRWRASAPGSCYTG